MIPLFKVHMPASVIGPLGKTLASGWVGQGPRVEEFEKKIMSFVGGKYHLALNSGTSALHLAYHLSGVGPGTNVVTTPMTCTATNLPLLALGAEIRCADVHPDTGLIDEKSAVALVDANTRAVVAVDWGGMPAVTPHFVRAIRAAAPRAAIVEDAAHAIGAQYRNIHVGATADFTAFSFQAIKHLTTGDGGLLTIRDKSVYRRGKLLRWYGLDRGAAGGGSSYGQLIADAGYKFHMNDIAATIGLEQLKYLHDVLVRHRHAASFYRFQFRERGIRTITLPPVDKNASPSWWLFTVLCDDRERFIRHMTAAGIAVSPVHRRNDEHPCFAAFARGPLPGVDRFASRQCAIPCGWWLTDKTLRYIMSFIEAYDKVTIGSGTHYEARRGL